MTNVAHSASLESQLKLAHEESDLFFLQLQLVRKELERFSLNGQKAAPVAPARLPVTAPAMQSWVDDDLPNALAENQRLSTLIEVLKQNGQFELASSLSVRVGRILVQGVDEPRRLLAAPAKLMRIWRESRRRKPPAALGGSDFSKVIAEHEAGGFDAVERLLSSSSGALYANACTALARHLMTSDRNGTAEAARRAYVHDPKPFRLKWLAFRLHEAGELIEAEAMLDALPAGSPFSESEQRQASELRYEARQQRLRAARKSSGYAERRAEVERRFAELETERDTLARTLEERSRAADELGKVVQQLQREVSELNEARAVHEGHSAKLGLSLKVLQQEYALLEEGKALAAREHQQQLSLLHERDREVAELKAAAERFEREMAAWISDEQEHALRLEEKLQEQGRLKASVEQLEQDKALLQARWEELVLRAAEQVQEIDDLQASKSALEREHAVLEAGFKDQARELKNSQRQIESLRSAKSRLDLDKALLKAGQAEQFRAATGRERDIKALRAHVERLEQERIALAARHDEHRQAQAAWRAEADGLKAAHARTEQEKAVLEVRHEERLRLVETGAREVDDLRSVVEQLEAERARIVRERDAALHTAAERLEQVEQLQQRLEVQQGLNSETSARGQRTQDEVARVEAQLELLKEMLL